MNLREKIKNIPKTELHCHIDGSLRPSTIIDLLIKNNLPLPISNLDKVEDYFKINGDCSSLKEYLSKFDFPIKVMQKKEELYRVTFELLEDAKKDGISYIELRFAPYFHTVKGLKPEEVVEAVLSAMKDAENKFNIYSGLILCAMRHESSSKAVDVINLAKKYIKSGVAAVDLAGNESDFPPEIHREAFDIAYETGLNITIHAGETGICENIMKSINILHASRIGHGIFAYKDQKTLDYLVQNQIPQEMSPKSNLDTKAVKSYREHPIKTYLENGLRVTLNTDNRTVSNINLVDEYMNLVNILGFTENQIFQIIKNGISSSFCSENLKNKLIKEFNKSL